MTSAMITTVVQVAGMVIVASVLAQSLMGIVSAFQRFGNHARQSRDTITRLHGQTELVLAQSRDERARPSCRGMAFVSSRSAKKVFEADNVHSFYLHPHDGKDLPPFRPGQYLTFQLKLPDAAKPLIQCYSLSDRPGLRDHYRVSIKKCLPPRDAPEAPAGKSSGFFNDTLQEGDILDVKAPSGHFLSADPGRKAGGADRRRHWHHPGHEYAQCHLCVRDDGRNLVVLRADQQERSRGA